MQTIKSLFTPLKILMSQTQQRAYLTVYFEGEGGYNNPANQIRYSTVDFEEVFKFRSIAKKLGAVHSVRFKEVKSEKVDYSHLNNTSKLLSSLNKIKDFFNRPLW